MVTTYIYTRGEEVPSISKNTRIEEWVKVFERALIWCYSGKESQKHSLFYSEICGFWLSIDKETSSFEAYKIELTSNPMA